MKKKCFDYYQKQTHHCVLKTIISPQYFKTAAKKKQEKQETVEMVAKYRN